MSKKINKSLSSEFRKGQIGINNQGLKMTIIEYRNSLNIDIQFEDGTIVEHRTYQSFLRGNIANLNYYNTQCMNNRIGETNINNQGLKMTIIEYRNAKDINVQFEDETIIEHKEYHNFLIGNIVNPNEYLDGISIPNKMLRQISFQLGLNLQFEYSPIWLENKRLDGYDDDLKIAIEMDAEYNDNHKGERKEVDNWKDEQCLKNGIYVIRIDLMNTNEYSRNKFEYIKKQILNSPLSLIYDLSNMDWKLAWKNSLKNLVWETKRLIEEGYMDIEIAEILGISECTVRNYKKELDIKTLQEIKQENIQKVKELLEQGKSVKEIVEILGVHRGTINNYKKELGIKTKEEIKQENIQKVKELLEQGKSNEEIIEILDVHETTVRRYIKELGVEVKTNKQKNLQKTKELLEQGKSVKEIAEILDVNRHTITNYKRELGLL